MNEDHKQHIEYLLMEGIKLPSSYEHLLKLFGQLDVNIQLLKVRNKFAPWAYSLSELIKMFEGSGYAFNLGFFQ